MMVFGSVVAICLELRSYKHILFRCIYEDLIARSVSYEYEQLILLGCSEFTNRYGYMSYVTYGCDRTQTKSLSV
jgi:hypothetical protein